MFGLAVSLQLIFLIESSVIQRCTIHRKQRYKKSVERCLELNAHFLLLATGWELTIDFTDAGFTIQRETERVPWVSLSKRARSRSFLLLIRHQRTLHRNLTYLIQFDPTSSHHANHLAVCRSLLASHILISLCFSHQMHLLKSTVQPHRTSWINPLQILICILRRQ